MQSVPHAFISTGWVYLAMCRKRWPSYRVAFRLDRISSLQIQQKGITDVHAENTKNPTVAVDVVFKEYLNEKEEGRAAVLANNKVFEIMSKTHAKTEY